MKRLTALVAILFVVASCSQKNINDMINNTKDLGTNVGTNTKNWGQQVGQNAAEHGQKIGEHVVNLVSLSNESHEDDLGQSVGVVLTNTYTLHPTDGMTKYVTLVGLAVASRSPRPDIQYVFGILDTDEVNAFSGPNGYIFITRGALKQMQDEGELAGVLGHEISHVFLHHGLQQAQAAEANAAFSETVKALPEAQRFSANVDQAVNAITNVSHTQPQEYAADENGVKVAAAAGYDPTSYLHFMQRLAAQQQRNRLIMSTHPGAADRVKRIEDQLKNMPPGGATLADRFKANVKFE